MTGRDFPKRAIGAAIFFVGMAITFGLLSRLGAAVACAALAVLLTITAVIWLTWRHEQ